MHTRLSNHLKNLLFPCFAFSIAVGVISAIFITAFKIAVDGIIHLSSYLYDIVRSEPIWLLLLIPCAALLGLAANFLLSYSHSCRGGGIPTSVAAIRGIVSFNWIKGIFLLPIASVISFFCGIPLGTEGPCVQMGTAIGEGVSKCFASKKQKGWRRYVMTGGASAGFCIATGSPISSILFSIEELHKRFSPLVLTVASLSVISAHVTSQLLEAIGIGTLGLFHITAIDPMGLHLMFVPVFVGIACGVFSILFTRLYHLIDKFMRFVRDKISTAILFPIIFATVATVGFFMADALGSGHSLIDSILSARSLGYFLLIVFLLRMVAMMISNTSGITGGIFLPTLAFGAIIGSLCGNALIEIGWLPAEFYVFTVILGITAFLGSTSRIPITACVFAIESLGGINNILPLIIAATVALLTVELSGLEDFTDTVIESKIKSINPDKTPKIIEVALTVNPDSFVVGKELRDILWPNDCIIVSFERAPENRENVGVSPGDVITVRYKTYDPEITSEELTVLVGEQNFEKQLSVLTR